MQEGNTHAKYLYSKEAEEQFQQFAHQLPVSNSNQQQFYHPQQQRQQQRPDITTGGPKPVFGGERSALVQEIQALENGYALGDRGGDEGYANRYFEKVPVQQEQYWTYETQQHQRAPENVTIHQHNYHQRAQSPSPPRQMYRHGQQQQQQYQQQPQHIQFQQYQGQEQQPPQQGQHQQYIQLSPSQEAYPPYIRQQQQQQIQQQQQQTQQIQQHLQQPQHQQQQFQHIQQREQQQPLHQQQQLKKDTWVSAVDDIYDGAFPSGPPPVFTTDAPQQAPPTVHYRSAAERRRAESEQARRHHSPVGEAAEQGYLFGGMDYIDHLSPNTQLNPNDYEWGEGGQHRSRRDEASGPPRRPGDYYGLDYNALIDQDPNYYINMGDDANYKGYVAQQPRKHWKFTADPNAQLNLCETVVVESVDPMRLIGDTLSNQKVHAVQELTEEEKQTFGTTFAPTPGFKPEHKTVRPEPKSPEPICFSLSAKKELLMSDQPLQTSTPGSRSQNAMVHRRVGEGGEGGPLSDQDSGWYTTGNKEIMRNEPNWTRNVNQRRYAWEAQSRSVDSRLQLPPWVKVPPQQPPYWTKRAHTTHNTWQTAADGSGGYTQGNYSASYDPNQDAGGDNQHQDYRGGNIAVSQPLTKQGGSANQRGPVTQLHQSGGYELEGGAIQVGQHGQEQGRQDRPQVITASQSTTTQLHQQQVPSQPQRVAVHQMQQSKAQPQPQQWVQRQSHSTIQQQQQPLNQNPSQVYYYEEEEEEEEDVGYGTLQNQQQQQQQQQQQPQRPKTPAVAPNQQRQQQQPQAHPAAPPHQGEKQMQQQQLHQMPAQFQDGRHRMAMEEAARLAAGQNPHTGPSATTNLINQPPPASSIVSGGPSRQEIKQGSVNVAPTHQIQQQQRQQQQPGMQQQGSGNTTTTTTKVMPSGRSQSHNISSSTTTTTNQQRVQPGQFSPLVQRKAQPEQTHFSPQVQRKAPSQQQQSQRNNYHRIIANRQPNQQNIASRYPLGQQQQQVQFDREAEMNERLPQFLGQLSHSQLNTSGQFRDRDGYEVTYTRELSTAVNPDQQMELLKQEESRVVDESGQQLQPGFVTSL